MEHYLLPQGMYRSNLLYNSIKPLKDNITAIVFGVTDDFLLGIWDELIPLVELTLNLLRQSNVAPNVSVHAHLTWPHNFNKIPLEPLGWTVLIHNNPGKLLTWAPHYVNGWYVVTSREQYQCYMVWAKYTRSKRVSNTLFSKKNASWIQQLP